MNDTDLAAMKSRFTEDGYVVLESVFTPDEVGEMQSEADRILEVIVNSSIANKRKSGRLDLVQSPAGDHLVRKIQPINDLSHVLTEVSRDERFLGPMKAVMNEDPILMEEKLNYKEPLSKPIPGLSSTRADDRFPIHSDWAYYKAQNYPQNIISSAICIDECTAENGPIHVWPGSHTEHREHERNDLGLEVKPGLIDRDGGIDLLAPAGSVLLFHALLIHNSKPNGSGRPRRLMIYSHYPSSFEMCPDVRNGPRRLEESPYEWEYIRRKHEGAYKDVFTAPSF